jgi:cytochrome P450
MQPAFHRKRIHAFGDVVVAATTDMLDRWAARPDGAELDVDAEMMQVALEIVGKTLFNLDLRREAPEMTEGVLEMLAYVVYRAKAMVAPPIAWPTARNRRYRAAMAKLEGVIYDTIAARRAGADGQGDGGSGDVLSMLLAARDEETGEGMTDAQIRDEMATLIIAGHETVASALTSAWFLLSRNPAARETLEAELDGALGGRPPTADDLPALPYTRMVFEETLRLYPPAWLITRRALAEDRIGDTVIPANALLIMSPYVTHRLPSFWPDPLRFEPRRFAPEAAADRPRFAYIPFGGGPRLCVGDSFALMEGPLILAATAQRFRLDLDPDREVVLDALVTLRPRGGLHMSALKRD